MTSKELKIKRLSHLEGNDLWDSMEADYIHEHKNDKAQDVTDWKGNVIKEGDEVCFIKIRTGENFSNLGLLIPDGEGGFTEYKTEEEPEEDCWVVGKYIKVEKGFTYTINMGEYTFNTPIAGLSFFEPNIILAIKGVSDVKE